MQYQPVPVPENLSKIINETNSLITKIQINQFNNDRVIARDDHDDDTKDKGQTGSNDIYNSADESYVELDSSQKLDCMMINKTFHQENKILLTTGSSKSMSISMTKWTGMTSTSTSKFLQGFLLQYLHNVVNTIVYLQQSLHVSQHDDILCHL